MSKGANCEAFIAPLAVYLDGRKTGKQWVEPDVFVVCDKNKSHDDGIYGASDWVVEVISKPTLEKDTIVKLLLYKTHGEKEYWIVNPITRQVHVYLFSPEYSMVSFSFERFLQHNSLHQTSFMNLIPTEQIISSKWSKTFCGRTSRPVSCIEAGLFHRDTKKLDKRLLLVISFSFV